MKITKDYIIGPRIEKISEYLKGDILDIGCGEGIIDIKAILNGKNIKLGIDTSPILLYKAKQHAIDSGVEFNTMFASIEDLPKDTKYDTILLGEVLEHIENPKQGILNALEILKDGGQIIITTPVGFSHYSPDHKNFFFTNNQILLLNHLWMFDTIPYLFLKTSKIINIEHFLKDIVYKYECDIYEYGDSTHPSLDFFIRILK